VLSVEGRFAPKAVADARAIRQRHEHLFRELRVVVHPPGLPGEVPGKGSNVGYAARLMTAELERSGVPASNVLLTCIDADTLVSPQYFSCLTYYFLAEPDRLHSCFQPLPVFRNNIWQTNSLVRVIEMSQTMFQLIDSTNVDTLVTFSCYSYSLSAIAEAGFWPPDVIGEDAAIYWKTFLYFHGDFKTVPLPVTVSMDAPQARTVWKTLRSAYKQKLRWAYGVENLVIVFRGLFHHKLVRGRRRRTTVLKFVDNGLAQATWPFILSLLIWLPRAYELIAQRNPLPVFNLGRISGVIFQLSGVFLALIVLVTGFFIYRKSRGVPLWKKVLYPLEWIIVLPVASVLLGGAPALHAQTKIAFGRPLTYVPMEKPRGAVGRSAARA